jgi:hypothetical protein
MSDFARHSLTVGGRIARGLGACLVGALTLSCSSTLFVATTGTAYRSSDHDDPELIATVESAAHDLDCPPAEVRATSVRGDKARRYLADGCGQRAVYDLDCVSGNGVRCTLVLASREALPSAAAR